jgi:hypothetical protein
VQVLTHAAAAAVVIITATALNKAPEPAAHRGLCHIIIILLLLLLIAAPLLHPGQQQPASLLFRTRVSIHCTCGASCSSCCRSCCCCCCCRLFKRVTGLLLLHACDCSLHCLQLLSSSITSSLSFHNSSSCLGQHILSDTTSTSTSTSSIQRAAGSCCSQVLQPGLACMHIGALLLLLLGAPGRVL